MKSLMFLEDVTSKPVVGSSNSRMGGSASSALAKASFLFMPPEYFWKNSKALSFKPTSSRTSMILCCLPCLGTLLMAAKNSRLLYPVSLQKKPRSPTLKSVPMDCLTCICCFTASKLFRIAVPSSGGSSVQSILTSVVLPAPLGPSKPKSSPFLIFKSRWLTAATVLVSPRLKIEVWFPGILIFDV